MGYSQITFRFLRRYLRMFSQKARNKYTRMGDPKVTKERYIKYNRTEAVDNPIILPKELLTPNAER